MNKDKDFLERNKKAVMKWRENNKDKVKEINKRWREKHPEQCKERDKLKYLNNKESHLKKLKLWNEQNPEKAKLSIRRCRLKKEYGLSIEQYNKIFENQNGCCAICKTHQSKLKASLCVDHNHITGQIRGLLCHKCNLIIGNAFENIDILKEAIDYCIRHSLITIKN